MKNPRTEAEKKALQAMPQKGVGVGRGKRQFSPGLARVYRTKMNWTEGELRAEGLPLYWSKRWFVQNLKRHRGSVMALARESGYKVNTLHNWRIHHGLERSKLDRSKNKERMIAWLRKTDKQPTRVVLAERFDMDVRTIADAIKAAGIKWRLKPGFQPKKVNTVK